VRKLLTFLICALVLGTLSEHAEATLMRLKFTASEFEDILGRGAPPPDEVVSGYLAWETNGDVVFDSLIDVKLTIAGTKYDLDDLTIWWYTQALVGGSLNDPNGIFYGTNDFWLSLYGGLDDSSAWEFVYATVGTQTAWRSTTFEFRFLPEPSMASLLCLALVAFALRSRARPVLCTVDSACSLSSALS
jgi:hypothetical protein